MSSQKILLNEQSEINCICEINSSKPLTDKPSVRLVCHADDMSFVFPGKISNQNEISISIPPMKNFIKEGKYKANLEIIIGESYIDALEMDLEFEPSVKVSAQVQEVKSAPKREVKIKAMTVKSLKDSFKK